MARPQKNNADYFSHDNNMRNHRKMKAIRNKFGVEGYGVFNMFLETLTECDGFKIKIDKDLEWELLSADFGVETSKLKEIINYCKEIELLDAENDFIFSENLIERLEPVMALREKKREWANKRWDNEDKTKLKKTKTELKTPKSMQSKVKETKLNKSKDINTSEQSSHIPPKIEDVKKYCLERDNNVDYDKWFNFYDSKGWLIGRNKMVNWKSAVRTWEVKKTTPTLKELPKEKEISQEDRDKNLKRMAEIKKGLNFKII